MLRKALNELPVRVTYLISTKNRASHLSKLFTNIREFIASEDELIVADGGSTDGTLDVIESNNDIVTSLITAPDSGEAHGFNRAILQSHGRVLKLLTDDDYFYPKPMHLCIDYLEEHRDVDVVVAGGRCFAVDEGGNMTFLWNHGLPPGSTYRERLGSIDAIGISGLGMFFRREVFAVTGLFDTKKRFVDIDYFARLLTTNLTIRYMDHQLFDHHIWSGSGCVELPKNPHFHTERVQAYFELGDWRSSASLGFRAAVEAFRLESAGIAAKCAFRILTLILRDPASLSARLLAVWVIPVGYAADLCIRIRRILLRFVPKSTGVKRSTSPEVVNEFLKQDRQWTGAVW